MITAVAIILLLAVVAYAVLGGADFGAGFWDLTAGGARRGERPRALVERSIGPVWEANHVWLVFILVITWSGFPEAYQSIVLTMFVPLTIAALGIVLRGASFAFRKAVASTRYRRVFGGGFALSSVLVPFCMGAMAGGIASGEVPAGGRAGDPVQSWLNPTSLLTGALAVVLAAYLAAVYLVREARRADDRGLVEHFRRRAVLAAVVAAAFAVAGALVLRTRAPHVGEGLTSRALPLTLLSVVCGAAALVLLGRRLVRATRVLAALAVASMVVAWGVAQWPYILPETLTFADAAAPSGTLTALAVATACAVLLVVPGFVVLYVLDQRGLLPDEGVEDEGAPHGPLGGSTTTVESSAAGEGARGTTVDGGGRESFLDEASEENST
ncbi:cytochrome d ubiquinol oxidase subunit II [Cellulosimicrobium sp. CUA-896]|uniref:cytochrome d ubiquinol oxidase subunit II n=1 Tax=Cellulosimicrobium sp. CUA-896 TaxID=1517881 RepID=UPI00095F667C|nr:cytochrome d ubiquinol oxidase subunit II [Cellulosimicrobium sp. CUA-896]OLT53081.1 cytochrome D ubiquinol oxidase subunit II [Cellulosimicrobium sp. CUA-896]